MSFSKIKRQWGLLTLAEKSVNVRLIKRARWVVKAKAGNTDDLSTAELKQIASQLESYVVRRQSEYVDRVWLANEAAKDGRMVAADYERKVAHDAVDLKLLYQSAVAILNAEIARRQAENPVPFDISRYCDDLSIATAHEPETDDEKRRYYDDKFSSKVIKLRVLDNSDQPIMVDCKARVIGQWGVHKDRFGSSYIVTHIETGLAMPEYFSQQLTAMAMARLLHMKFGNDSFDIIRQNAGTASFAKNFYTSAFPYIVRRESGSSMTWDRQGRQLTD